MKKNKMMRLAACLLVMVLLTTSMIAGTFAKYTSEAYGTNTARVAKWSFEVNDADIATTDKFTFDLFKTINDTDGTTEGDVKKADQIIAPGTSGFFELVLENTSEVTAKYGIVYTITNTAGIPLKYSVDGGKSWTDTLVNVDADDSKTKIDMGKSSTIKVQWKWDYARDNGDIYDTTLGVNAAADNAGTVTVQAKVTATQVD